MATIQSQLVCDSSTLTNFKQWAQAISTAFSTFGWLQSSDTGQVNWSSLAAVPGSGAYVYDIWQPNDGLTNFFLKVEYGNVTANAPNVRVSVGTSTNGAGTLTGNIVGPLSVSGNGSPSGSTTATYECNFSGAAGRFAAMLWRNGPLSTACQQLFAVERSLNTGGSYTGSYVTLWALGYSNNPRQQTLHLTAGPTIASNWITRGYASASLAFNGSIAVDLAAPAVGYFDVPCTVIGSAYGADMVEGVPFSVTLFGNQRTYMPSKLGNFAAAGPAGNTSFCACMRYD